MQFHLNEGSFTLPDGLRDNSMNMLLTGHSGLDLSLIITRDRLDPGESFEAFVDRQIKAVTLQVSKFSIRPTFSIRKFAGVGRAVLAGRPMYAPHNAGDAPVALPVAPDARADAVITGAGGTTPEEDERIQPRQQGQE